nr:helix-turn-helix domain-containing protein [Prevotella sp.]
MEKNNELRLAWDFVEHTGRSIFLTGKAGTGKTTFLKTIREKSKKRIIVVAPTGVAAINAQGVTIHSFFQLPPSVFVPETKIEQRFSYGKEKRNIMRTLDLLVIDEISMVRSDLLDAIDMVLRRFREHNKPFGGVQLLMIGDLQQLTPVVTPTEEEILKPHYSTPYFFGSHALQSINYVTIELTHVYRQQDETFIKILNDIREGKTTQDDLDTLNKHYDPSFHPKPEEGFIRLTTHNRFADNYNETELKKLIGSKKTYHADINGQFPDYLFPTSTALTLKVGAQVMFVKNDSASEHRYYNGRIGHITHLMDDSIFVLCPGDDMEIEVKKETWENTKYAINEETKLIVPEVQGSFAQFPLKLAWSITIHKSQGLTFERAIIDAQFSFASGQVYVALSRCKNLDGLVLASPISSGAIKQDQRVDEYIQHQEEAAKQSIDMLPTLKQEYERFQLIELFNFWGIKQMEDSLYRLMIEYFQSFPKTVQLHKIMCSEFNNNIINTSVKWTNFIASLSFEQIHEEDFLERVKRSATYYNSQLSKIFDTLLNVTKGVASNNKIANKRLDTIYTELTQTYNAKKLLLNDIARDGFTTTNYLKYKQEALLIAVDGKTKNRKRTASGSSETTGGKSKEPKKKTGEISFEMFKAGKSVPDIAKERDLTTGTIINHLSNYVLDGSIPVNTFITEDHQKNIRDVISRIGTTDGMKPIKELCQPEITWDEIRLMINLMKKE